MMRLVLRRLFCHVKQKSAVEHVQKCLDSDNPAHAQSIIQGPVVQGIVSLTNSLVVKMLTVLVSTISNSQVFLLKKCE